MLRIRIGTRSSPLALAQVKIIAGGIRASYPDADIVPVKITTSGDKDMSTFSTDPNGIKGIFTLEIERALMAGEIDLAVHSLKDLPANINPMLPIVAYSHRGDPRDALVLGRNSQGGFSVIGSSSLRRRLQLGRLYPSAKIIPVRGNIGTRLRRLDEGEYSGLVLAVSGLERLGLSGRITRVFTTDEVMPSPGQGILACQGRAGESYPYLEAVNDECSRDCAIAERAFARELGAGCNVPVGAYAEIAGDILTLRGLYVDDAGNFRRGILSGRREYAGNIGRELSGVIMG